jgi:hypothetical protein
MPGDRIPVVQFISVEKLFYIDEIVSSLEVMPSYWPVISLPNENYGRELSMPTPQE